MAERRQRYWPKRIADSSSPRMRGETEALYGAFLPASPNEADTFTVLGYARRRGAVACTGDSAIRQPQHNQSTTGCMNHALGEGSRRRTTGEQAAWRFPSGGFVRDSHSGQRLRWLLLTKSPFLPRARHHQQPPLLVSVIMRTPCISNFPSRLLSSRGLTRCGAGVLADFDQRSAERIRGHGLRVRSGWLQFAWDSAVCRDGFSSTNPSHRCQFRTSKH